MHTADECMLNVDCRDLHSFSSELYDKLIKYPTEVITLMDSAVKYVYASIAAIAPETAEIQVGAGVPVLSTPFIHPGMCHTGWQDLSCLWEVHGIEKSMQTHQQTVLVRMSERHAEGHCHASSHVDEVLMPGHPCAGKRLQPAGDKGDPGPQPGGHRAPSIRQRHGNALQQHHSRSQVGT